MARELNNKFSWKTATFMAKLSYYSYAGEDEFNKQFKKQWDNIEFFDKGGTQCFVLHCPKNYVVVFRGTEPTSWEDIKADIQFTKQKKEYQPSKTGHGSVGKIHRGFRDALNDVWPDLISHYNYHAKGKQLLVTGHSLGAALATLYTDRMNDNKSVCYTFGSPRVGNKELIKNMNFACYRIRNNNDIVTRVPPEWLGYTHKGELKYFDVDGQIRHGFSRSFMFMQWIKGTYRTLMRDKTWDAFADHSMGEYLKLCKGYLIEENAEN
tara:strand:- start:1937 stop:2734 length:798 start_codon:yes stop_codon:yes gene_type:complete